MKRLLSLGLLFILLSACNKSEAAYPENGKTSQIKAIAFYDNNENGTMDSGEEGAQVEVGISQDMSCPPSSMDKITIVTTDSNGVALFTDLKPGEYCVTVNVINNMTTKDAQNVIISNDLVSTVIFGIVRAQ